MLPNSRGGCLWGLARCGLWPDVRRRNLLYHKICFMARKCDLLMTPWSLAVRIFAHNVPSLKSGSGHSGSVTGDFKRVVKVSRTKKRRKMTVTIAPSRLIPWTEAMFLLKFTHPRGKQSFVSVSRRLKPQNESVPLLLLFSFFLRNSCFVLI